MVWLPRKLTPTLSLITPTKKKIEDEKSGPGMKFGNVIYSTDSGAAPTNVRCQAGCPNCPPGHII